MTEQVNVIVCPYWAAPHHCNCSITIIVVIVAIAVTVVIVITTIFVIIAAANTNTNTVAATAPLISSLSHCYLHQEYQSSLKSPNPCSDHQWDYHKLFSCLITLKVTMTKNPFLVINIQKAFLVIRQKLNLVGIWKYTWAPTQPRVWTMHCLLKYHIFFLYLSK